jgi:integral membrane sensor domain MASE1
VVRGNPLHRALGEALLVGGGYAVLAETGTLLYLSVGGPCFWPANAWAMAFLSRRRFRAWPLLLGVVTAEIVVDRYHGLPWATGVRLGLANACEGVFGAWSGQRFVGRPVSIDSARKLLRFVVLMLRYSP